MVAGSNSSGNATRASDAECLHGRNIDGAQPVAGLPQHFADAGIGAGHQHALARSHRHMHLAVAAAPRHGFKRRHRVAVVVQRLAHRDLAKLRQDGGCIGPGVGGRFRVHRPAIDQGQRRRWMQFCDHNVLRQCGAQRSTGPHFARRYRVDAFGDPPHDVIERHQARDPLAMLQGGNHAGYVAGTGGRGQEGAADMLDAPVWIDETTPEGPSTTGDNTEEATIDLRGLPALRTRKAPSPARSVCSAARASGIWLASRVADASTHRKIRIMVVLRLSPRIPQHGETQVQR
jgi:hypothetical protein